MRIEDIEVGMEVKALQKSICPLSFAGFCDHNPNRIGGVRLKTNEEHSDLPLGTWWVSIGAGYYFLPEDLIPAKIANQTVDDFKVGMQVKAHRKSILSASWENFLEAHPDGIGDVRLVLKQRLTIDVWDFLATDLEILDPPKEETWGPSIVDRLPSHARIPFSPESVPFIYIDSLTDAWKYYFGSAYAKTLKGYWDMPTPSLEEDIMTTPKSNIVAFKPITCQAIAARIPVSCGDFRKFVKRVSGVDMHYLWDPIPPELAQGIAAGLGYPTWFEDQGFIAIEEEKPRFDPLQVFLEQEEDKVRIRYKGAPIGFLDKNGFYRTGFHMDPEFPIKLDQGKINVQN